MMNKLANFLGIAKKSGNLVHGTDEVLDKFSKNNIKLVLSAKDTAENTLKKLKKNISDIKIINLTKNEIENAIGKHTGVLGILDEGVAKRIIEILQEEI